MYKITRAIAQDDFSILLMFSKNGQEEDQVKIFDAKKHLFKEKPGVFEPLLNIEEFKRVQIGGDGRTLVWDHDHTNDSSKILDLCADAVYMKSINQKAILEAKIFKILSLILDIEGLLTQINTSLKNITEPVYETLDRLNRVYEETGIISERKGKKSKTNAEMVLARKEEVARIARQSKGLRKISLLVPKDKEQGEVVFLIKPKKRSDYSLFDLIGLKHNLEECLLIPIRLVTNRSIDPKFKQLIEDEILIAEFEDKDTAEEIVLSD